MTMLVSLSVAKTHLRIDNNDDDSEVTIIVQGASRAVLNYIKNGADPFTDSSGEVIEDSSGPVGVPDDVISATLLMAGYLYRLRDGDPDKEFGHGYLPLPVISLLYPYRVLSLS